MKKAKQQLLIAVSVMLTMSDSTQAALLGVVQTYPDITLNQNYLIYDSDGIDSNTGLLKLFAYGSTLNEGPSAGNSTLTQSYSGLGDPYPNLMLTIAIDRNTGSWVSTSHPGANRVSIGFGNTVIPNGAAITPGFSWQGNITGFGWQADIASTLANEFGTFFDASWTFTSDDYEDIPTSLAQFTDNVLTSTMAAYQGGIKIANSAGFGNISNAFQHDWVFGANANTTGIQTLLSALLTGMSSTACSTNTQTSCTRFVHSNVIADVFAPIPPAFAPIPSPSVLWLLWIGAFAWLSLLVRRHPN